MQFMDLVLLSLLLPPLVASPMDPGPSNPVDPGPSQPPPPSSRVPGLPEAYSEWACFEQRYSHRPLRTVYFKDCDAALQTLENADKLKAPMMFSRTTGYKVPHTINVGSCSIMLDINDKTADKTVTVPLKIIVTSLHLILANCVHDGPPPGYGLGGFTEIHSPDGSGGIMDIVVVGRFSPAEDPPPYAPGSVPRYLYKPGG